MTPFTSIVPNGTMVTSLAIFRTLSIFDTIWVSSTFTICAFFHSQLSCH